MREGAKARVSTRGEAALYVGENASAAVAAAAKHPAAAAGSAWPASPSGGPVGIPGRSSQRGCHARNERQVSQCARTKGPQLQLGAAARRCDAAAVPAAGINRSARTATLIGRKLEDLPQRRPPVAALEPPGRHSYNLWASKACVQPCSPRKLSRRQDKRIAAALRSWQKPMATARVDQLATALAATTFSSPPSSMPPSGPAPSQALAIRPPLQSGASTLAPAAASTSGALGPHPPSRGGGRNLERSSTSKPSVLPGVRSASMPSLSNPVH